MAARILPTSALLLVATACAGSFDPAVRSFRCDTAADCSAGYTCHPVSKVCVPSGGAVNDTGGPGNDIPPPWEQDQGTADPGGPEPSDGSFPPDPIDDPADSTDMDYPWPEELPSTCGDGFCNGDETSASCPADCGYEGEICDGEDDDHDGYTDEGTAEPGGHCDDGDSCTVDTCNGFAGCAHAPDPSCGLLPKGDTTCQRCLNDAHCMGENEVCAVVDGVGYCAPGCTLEGTYCHHKSTCTTDDNAKLYCPYREGDGCCYGPYCDSCVNDIECLGFGICSSGECKCFADQECTDEARGMVCNTNTNRCVLSSCRDCSFPTPACNMVGGTPDCHECAANHRERCEGHGMDCDVNAGRCVARDP